MTLTKCTAITNSIGTLSDTPTETASELKSLFDKAGEEIKDYLNDTLTVELDMAIPSVINDLTTGGANNAASAETVKTLNGIKQKTILYGTAEPSSGSDGDIYLRYL